MRPISAADGTLKSNYQGTFGLAGATFPHKCYVTANVDVTKFLHTHMLIIIIIIVIIIIIIMIIIYPLTVRVVGAPRMILQPVFSIVPCSPLPSKTFLV